MVVVDCKVPTPPTSNHPHVPLPDARGSIIYCETDEAPALATYSLLPIFQKYAAVAADIDVLPCDISLAGRVLAAFPEKLRPEQRVPDNLAYLGDLCTKPEANVIKLPNISASVSYQIARCGTCSIVFVASSFNAISLKLQFFLSCKYSFTKLPQLNDCIKELRVKGYDVPLYVSDPKTDEEKDIKERYARVLGSAVNPVLRKGNSDRHAAPVVKADAQKNPSRLMKVWSKASRSHVAHMDKGDFYGSEMSHTVQDATEVAIELVKPNGQVKVLKASIKLLPGEVIDATFMDVEELCKFYEKEMEDAKKSNILFSLHLKATMMKVSDPILFGHALTVFFKDAYDKHGATLDEIGARANDGLRALYTTIEAKLPADRAKEIINDFEKCYDTRPWLAMVNSDKGITNLHCPSDIIVDNSMPVVIRDGGCMWNKLGNLEDCKCVIPDRSYSTMYQEVISYTKANGQFDPATMGHVSNVGLMALKAEEYGSHDKTFEVESDGIVRVRDINSDYVYFQHEVKKGDVWRMCQTKDEPIKDWVRLGVERARDTGDKAIFWLDPDRAHDNEILNKVNLYLKHHDLADVDVSVMKPEHAIRLSMERATKGLNTISITGNVLRDYLTDLFPILELGTSAKLLSIVPLLSGGGLYETGAGGSAPKHVQQFVQCDHLRWNSLGEYQAMAEAFIGLGKSNNNPKATLLGECLYQAIGVILERHEMPERRAHELDNRDTNYFVAVHWAEFLSKHDANFLPIYQSLAENQEEIQTDFDNCQGNGVDLGGYYKFCYEKTKKAMNPSEKLNAILDAIPSGGGGSTFGNKNVSGSLAVRSAATPKVGIAQ